MYRFCYGHMHTIYSSDNSTQSTQIFETKLRFEYLLPCKLWYNKSYTPKATLTMERVVCDSPLKSKDCACRTTQEQYYFTQQQNGRNETCLVQAFRDRQGAFVIKPQIKWNQVWWVNFTPHNYPMWQEELLQYPKTDPLVRTLVT